MDGPEGLKGVDIALNQNLDGRVTSREGRLDLCGLDYALLRAEFRNASPIDPSMNVRRLLVTLGAADPDGHTGPLLETLGPLAQGNDLTVVVVIGGHNERRDELMEIARVSPWVEAHEDVADMARLMSTCQLALSASGSTLWELCALGLPRAVLSLAPNQEPLAVAAEAHGAAVNLGRSEALEHQNVASALKGLIADPKRRESQARAGRSMVDGQGAHRVAQALSEAT